ncbi:hypothetical protein ACFL96_10480 [Thermoproteota archaeon]
MDLTKGIDALATRVNVHAFLDSIDYRVARTPEELEKAYALVYQEYLKRNYTDTNESKLRLSLYNALPQSTTFIAATNGDVLATATLITDSALGLPMDKLYSQELKKFRDDNKKICEISMLASNTEMFKSGIGMMSNAKKLFFVFFLFKVIFDYAWHVLDLDYMCITINPKHYLTYEFLLFKDFGGLKTYDGVRGAPAIGKFLDIKGAEEECKQLHREGLYKMFFSNTTPSEKFDKKITLNQNDLKYFFVQKSQTFKNASQQELKEIKSHYPSYDFSKIIC